jgi:hypothetical protein
MGDRSHLGDFAFSPNDKFKFTPNDLVTHFNICLSYHTGMTGVKAPIPPPASFKVILAKWFGLIPCSLLEAWALVRSVIVVMAQHSTPLRQLEERLRHAVAGVYPVHFAAEASAFAGMYETFSYYAQAMFGACSAVQTFCQAIFLRIIKTPTLLYSGLVEAVAAVVASSFVGKITDRLKQLLDFLTSTPGLCLFKTVIRYLLGYKWEQIVLEILFENEFLAWITGRVQSFTIKSFEAIFHPPLESEAPLDEFLRFLISLLVGSVGIKANHVTKLVSGMSTAATALDKFQFADYVNQIYAYFSEDNLHAKDLLRFRHSYPSTMLFIDTHS